MLTRDSYEQIANPVERAHARVAYWREMATAVENYPTETVLIGDLKPGDVIRKVHNSELPFAYELITAEPVGDPGNFLMRARHGWFCVGKSHHTCERVIMTGA